MLPPFEGERRKFHPSTRPPKSALHAIAPTALARSSYPTRQIKIICPFPADGGTDLTSRLLGEQLSRTLRQTFAEENRTGASGMIGTGAAASAPVDGYTLLVASSEAALRINGSKAIKGGKLELRS